VPTDTIIIIEFQSRAHLVLVPKTILIKISNKI
jgi:hypothetical protein